MEPEWETVRPVTLEELSPRYGWRAYWANVLLIEILLLLFPGAFILGATWALFWLSVTSLIVLPIALLCGWSHMAYMRSKAGTVSYSNGQVSTVVDSDMLAAPLGECRWYFGYDTRATVHRPVDILTVGVPAILIEFPHRFETEGRDLNGKLVPTGPVIVAVGYDDESRKEWQELLAGSDAIHDLQRESMPSPPSTAMYLLLLAILIPACFIGLRYTANAIDAGLVAVGMADEVACGVSGSLAITALLILFLYFFLLFRLNLRRYCVTDRQRHAAVEPLKACRMLLLAIFLLCGVVPLVGLLARPDEDLAESILQAVATLILTTLAALHFRYLLKEPKPAD